MTLDQRHISIVLSEKVDKNLTRLAKAAGQKKSDFALALFLAAYAARCGETGDAQLEAAVSDGGVASRNEASARDMAREAFAKLSEAEARIAQQERELIGFRNTSHRRRELEQEATLLRREKQALEAQVELKTEEAGRGHRALQGLMAELEEARLLPPPVRTDDLVLAIIMAWGGGLSSADIADRCGLHESTVERTLSTWRSELADRERQVAA